MIETVEEENEEIKRFFAKIEKYKDEVICKNKETIRNL